MVLQGILHKRNIGGRDASEVVPRLLKQIEQSGPIRCPFVLISQVSRSGGTWLSQLLDHHPQLWVHPLEPRFGHSRKSDWPDLSAVKDPHQAWELIRYVKAEEAFGSGSYSKGSDDTHPMLFCADVQQALFLRLADIWPPQAARDWFDIYFTSFFSAWLDHQRRYGAKRYVAGFASMLALAPDSMREFRQVYPDGWLISIVREPLGWFASVKQRALTDEKPKRSAKKVLYGKFEDVEAAYLDNIKAIHNNRALFGDRFVLLDYAALAADTEAAAKMLAARLGLDWHPSLTRQTFNGMPIKPNTSFQGVEGKSRSSILTEEDVARIHDGQMMAAYRTIHI